MWDWTLSVPKTILSALYFILWWLSLLIVLPLGVKTQAEEGVIAPGTISSAPVRFRLWKKILQATLLSFFLWLLFAALIIIYGFPH